MFEAADRLDLRASGVTDKVLQVAQLRETGVTYAQIAARLSISLSTARYRQSRYEQASDPIPFFRVSVRLLCAAGLRIDEACRTRRCDVDLIAKRLNVGRAKTDAGVRAVQLTPDTVADLQRYLQLTSERPASWPLLPTSNGTRYNRTNAGASIIKPLVAQTNAVLAEQGQPALRDGVTAHALRKTYFTFLHEAGAPPRWVADQGGHADPSHRCGSTPSRCATANEASTARRSTTCSTVTVTGAPTARDKSRSMSPTRAAATRKRHSTARPLSAMKERLLGVPLAVWHFRSRYRNDEHSRGGITAYL
jgi:hypothetical protein